MADLRPPHELPAMVLYRDRDGKPTGADKDWAVHELVPLPRHRRVAVVLVASSYVTWTYQTHTFSNSLETLLVAWGLVLIRRILENRRRSAVFSCAVLSFICVAGVFNRITFPAYLAIPGLQLVPHFWRRPLSLVSFVGFGLIFLSVAISTDTAFYNPSASFWDIVRSPVITPINNLVYNTDTSNLALHGLHPHYHHFLVNLPQLLGPALIWIAVRIYHLRDIPSRFKNIRVVSALSATAMLSIFPHQEPRFLIPCVPLLLSCLHVHKSRIFLATWVIFNVALGFLMGVYHQGGVVPTQLAVPSIISASSENWHKLSQNGNQPVSATVLWWKTYSPPLWLLGDNSSLPLNLNIETRDLMGMPGSEMVNELEKLIPSCRSRRKRAQYSNSKGPRQPDAVFVVAPKSATFLDQFTAPDSIESSVELYELWTYRKHISLDDLDFGTDGILPTLKRVIGRRGLGVWLAKRAGCN
ncbi:hypothetical protein AOCH_000245 [Aspergillus ochraceoroseus]|uniref:Mannosyltransferase n=1 Tax=Aspergillus ochraceoroseus TaxID=138278 RepID=A0A0F8WZT5_9EURO|nr:hypothetical protein AOCH_000245 [Aspergillus ochraceoroseus]